MSAQDNPKDGIAILIAQAAMGWIYRGDVVKAQERLAHMTQEELTDLAAAATTLASMADKWFTDNCCREIRERKEIRERE